MCEKETNEGARGIDGRSEVMYLPITTASPAASALATAALTSAARLASSTRWYRSVTYQKKRERERERGGRDEKKREREDEGEGG